MKTLKKIVLSLIVITCIFLFNTKNANAVLINEGNIVGGQIQILWIDAEDYFKQRPHEITVPYYATGRFGERDDIEVTLKESEADRIIHRGQAVIWEFDNVIVKNVEIDDDFGYNLDESNFVSPEGYKFDPAQSIGSLAPDYYDFSGGYSEIVLIKTGIVKSVNAIACHEDDHGRDEERPDLSFFVKETNTKDKKTRHIQLDYFPKGEDCLTVPNAFSYRLLNEDVHDPNFQTPVKYEYELANLDPNIKLEVLDNYDVKVTRTKPAKKIDVPIELVWNDENNKYGKRPSTINIDALNQDNEVESELSIPTNNNLYTAKLFENMKYSYGRKKVDYTLDVKNEDSKYTYDVVKNDDGSFTITATYHKDESDDVVPTPIKDSDDNNKTDKIETKNNNPETGDDIIKNILLLIGSITALGMCYKSYIKRLR